MTNTDKTLVARMVLLYRCEMRARRVMSRRTSAGAAAYCARGWSMRVASNRVIRLRDRLLGAR